MVIETSTKIKINNEWATVYLNNPLEWEYVAEGHKHAVFSPRCYPPPSHKKLNVVLRIPKSTNNNQDDSSGNKSKEYLERVIVKAIGEQYVNVPYSLLLSYDFVHKLAEEAVIKTVPKSRIDSWKQLLLKKPLLGLKCGVHATLQIDYRVLLLNPDCNPIPNPSDYNNNIPPLVVSVEIKPKAGYAACSPLINPKHRHIKLGSTRFSIIQRLLKRNLIQRGWTSNNNSVTQTQYCPLDLFSNNSQQIKHSLQALFLNPQNNLKLWYNNNTQHQQQCTENEIITKNILLQIFLKEPILQKLQKIQQCNDLVDVDGIILIYKRLLKLCSYDYNLVESYCDNFMNTNLTCFTLCQDNDYILPISCPALKELLDTVSTFKRFTHLPGTTSNNYTTNHTTNKQSWIKQNQSILDHEYNQCITNIIPNLNKESCIFLIQHWLLSLTMSDVSLFITISQLQKHHPTRDRNKLQGKDHNGCIVLNENDSSCCFEYFIKIVDYDPKPSSKLRNREKMENLIRLL